MEILIIIWLVSLFYFKWTTEFYEVNPIYIVNKKKRDYTFLKVFNSSPTSYLIFLLIVPSIAFLCFIGDIYPFIQIMWDKIKTHKYGKN